MESWGRHFTRTIRSGIFEHHYHFNSFTDISENIQRTEYNLRVIVDYLLIGPIKVDIHGGIRKFPFPFSSQNYKSQVGKTPSVSTPTKTVGL